MKYISRSSAVVAAALLCMGACLGRQASAGEAQRLSLTPPMGWNDWAHYQCDYTAGTILANARALVSSGLAARGYNTITVDDCWMQKTRDSRGDLQFDPRLFPHGIRPVAAAIHALGLEFGIYEDAGYDTCGGFAGSGEAQQGGEPHFAADAKLFAGWGVDYLKLDGCNVHVPPGESRKAAYRAAYQAESAALAAVGRPIVFSESAPAYFQGTPDWYDVLSWVRDFGQLWREGTDVQVYESTKPDQSRFASVMWNYDYNLPLARFQRPGNWNDADFIIGGDPGMTLAESRSQLALWSMMSAPLILSSDLPRLSPGAVAILGNQAVLAVDQDPLGRMATLLRRSAATDVLIKPLQDGDYAVAVLNRASATQRIELRAHDLGFAGARCRFDVQDLWSGARQASAEALRAQVQAHDTDIWTIRPAADCDTPARIGVISRIVPHADTRQDAAHYTRCMAAPGVVRACRGARTESWEITTDDMLRAGHSCLTQVGRHTAMRKCRSAAGQRWHYTLLGNLISEGSHLCLTGPPNGRLEVRACGHNLASQIWSLPNALTPAPGMH